MIILSKHARILITAATLAAAVCFIIIIPTCRSINTSTGYVSPNALIINEVVAVNQYCLRASDGSSPDWIEIYNGTEQVINLRGYGITDDLPDLFKFRFPEVYIKPGDYMLLYVASEYDDSSEDGYLRLRFELSGSGETLILSSPNSEVTDTFTYEDLPVNVSYGRADNGDYVQFLIPTPGGRNSGVANVTELLELCLGDPSLIINEYMPDNEFTIRDEDGRYSDWVEVKNTSLETIHLQGFGLSDDNSDDDRWVFPDIALEEGEVLLVFLSGSDRSDSNSELHTDFALGSSDAVLILSNRYGYAINTVELKADMGDNVSRGRSIIDPDKWLFYAEPTPGEENTTAGFETIQELSVNDFLPDIYISEVKTVSSVQSSDEDWIEITNRGDSAVVLSGYGLSDNTENLFAYTIENAILEPGEYIVFESEGGQNNDGLQVISLSYAGESVYFTEPSGRVVDHFYTGHQRPEISSGRADCSSTTTVYFTDMTRGSENSSIFCTTYTEEPEFSVCGGYTEEGMVIELIAEEGAVIYYTFDGSKPRTSSTVYSSPIVIDESTPIQAIAVKDGKLPSGINTETFLVENEHDIPVICITSDPTGLFSSATGIYARGQSYDYASATHYGANYWRNWEREVCFEFFEADGSKGVEFRGGIQIFGQFSRMEAKKGFAIHMRGCYGVTEITYPFFLDYDVTTFGSLLLRTSGQDWDKTMLRDVFFSQSARNTMDLDYMEYRPAALYINGEYWGLYYLREKQNEDYIYNHYGVEADDVDIIKGNRYVRAGSNEDNMALRAWVRASDMSVEENYEYLTSQVDVYEFMDYIILQTFFNNTDTGNIRIWKQHDTGRWRWMLFDMDWGMFPTTYRWNSLREFFNPAGHGIGDNFYSHMQMALLENDEWVDEFIEMYAWHLQNTFNHEALSTLLDKQVDEIYNEMERNIERWGRPSSMEMWLSNIEELREMLGERAEIVKEDLQYFCSLSDERMTELFGED